MIYHVPKASYVSRLFTLRHLGRMSTSRYDNATLRSGATVTCDTVPKVQPMRDYRSASHGLAEACAGQRLVPARSHPIASRNAASSVIGLEQLAPRHKYAETCS